MHAFPLAPVETMPLPADRLQLTPQDFPSWTDYYWEYQHRLARLWLVPCLREWGVWPEGARVLDVGCGDGGASCALAEAGGRVDGIDLDERRVRGGVERGRARGQELGLRAGDITDPHTLQGLEGPYDLVLFRDVLEHIPDRRAALEQATRRLSPRGAILVIFPPYRSPYGGHQQILHPPRILGLRPARLPWAHLLPRPLFERLANAPGRPDPQWEEILTIRRARLGLRSLAKEAAGLGLRVERSRHYLLRPTFALRYGLPVLRADALGRFPLLGDLLITGSYQLLRPTG